MPSARSRSYLDATTFLARVQDAYAGRRTPWRWGTALWNDSYRKIWDLNFARLDESEHGATAGAELLARELEQVQGAAGLEHRKLTVLHGDAGASLAPGFAALGWRVQTLLVMVKEESPGRGSRRDVAEVTVADLRPALERYFRTAPDIEDEETRRQIVDQYDIVPRDVDVRYFAVRSGGEVASFCLLFSHGRIAQVEDVMTLEEHRNHGYARAVVSAAVDAARQTGAELVFLIADADDWPQQMYRKLGFVERGRVYEFIKGIPSS